MPPLSRTEVDDAAKVGRGTLAVLALSGHEDAVLCDVELDGEDELVEFVELDELDEVFFVEQPTIRTRTQARESMREIAISFFIFILGTPSCIYVTNRATEERKRIKYS